MVFHKPTGNFRHRPQPRLFRKPLAVLQIEIRARGYEIDSDLMGRDVDHTYWRDATFEDLSAMRLTDGFVPTDKFADLYYKMRDELSDQFGKLDDQIDVYDRYPDLEK